MLTAPRSPSGGAIPGYEIGFVAASPLAPPIPSLAARTRSKARLVGVRMDPTNLAITRRCLVGDKGSGSKGGGKKPKGGLKPGDKKR